MDIRLLIAFLVLLAGSFASESLLQDKVPMKYGDSMTMAADLAREWFSVIEELKNEKGVISDAGSNVPYSFMIGDEWSEITTSLGSLEAKETSTNPDFAALIVRLLNEADVKKGDRVGVILSGSFPSLAISALAALQIMEIDAIVMSSVGSSTYGANQPDVTWVDMESRLVNRAGMKYRSSIVSTGAGKDAGVGLTEEGITYIQEAARRNGISLFAPSSLIESIEIREAIFQKEEISLLINIGGNESALGSCSHSLGIPNGLNLTFDGCSDITRGVISRIGESGIPFINMLDIKDLASRYGIAVSPGSEYAESTNLYEKNRKRVPGMIIILIIGLSTLLLIKKNSYLKP